MLAIDGERCLLGRAGRFVANMWSCLAGFVEPGESIEEAARRETLEEAGIVCSEVKYFRSQPWPFPMSLMIGCHAEAISTEVERDAANHSGLIHGIARDTRSSSATRALRAFSSRRIMYAGG